MIRWRLMLLTLPSAMLVAATAFAGDYVLHF
jgi:hypothetical protein